MLVLYRRRIATVFQGLIGRSEEGRNLLIALVVAFLPAAVIGFLFEGPIKSRLFAGWPIVAAWAVGGVAILLISDRIAKKQAAEAAAGGSGSGGGKGADTAGSIGTTPGQDARPPGRVGRSLDAITPRHALIIGVAQALPCGQAPAGRWSPSWPPYWSGSACRPQWSSASFWGC